MRVDLLTFVYESERALFLFSSLTLSPHRVSNVLFFLSCCSGYAGRRRETATQNPSTCSARPLFPTANFADRRSAVSGTPGGKRRGGRWGMDVTLVLSLHPYPARLFGDRLQTSSGKFDEREKKQPEQERKQITENALNSFKLHSLLPVPPSPRSISKPSLLFFVSPSFALSLLLLLFFSVRFVSLGTVYCHIGH